MLEEVQNHSVHTLVFRSLKRTHDMFVADSAKPVQLDEESHKLKMAAKLHAQYGPVLPILEENLREKGAQSAVDAYGRKEYPANQGQELEYLVPGPHLYAPGPGVALPADTKMRGMPSESAAQSLPVALPPSQSRRDASSTSASLGDTYPYAGLPDCSQPPVLAMEWMEAGDTKNAAMTAKKTPTMPKPQWHPPWKLYRVISGHLGWVRCIEVEPGNQWFVTGSADRTIKVWDLASGKLKLSLTGHIGTVRGVRVSARSPYLFSCGEDKQVKCWDLEYNKVIRHYHGHLSAVYGLDLHPTLDVLLTCSRDSTARIWDVRTKASVHTLVGHTAAVATVKCQGAEPQIITGSHDATIRLWDLVAGKTRVTLTNHKKSVRALVLHPRYYTFASGSPDNIKQWKFPDGNFIQNLSGHDAIVNTLAVNLDGVLVSGADNGTMHLWDWRTGYNFQRLCAAVQPGSLDSESGIFACAFDQSESRLLTAEADKTIKVYREDDLATEETHPIIWKPEIRKRKRF
ncbi:pleiotropic regulator 1-like [Trichosurus vulpecula]|uniref:pleiotropic regulator 1-like n=1 Tax=Trichosurus vulpecula TaxID=9337 RepID=UPI00186AE530|nr:pleiotropic regulator 1-like [Trichosurus vulpecula]